ncbi:hypothetical protein E5288_WYG020406 [Bos mutus]|uniref:Uncharacterized protein n=1 Tax=Bos mutus TaxID=72004 RepID=A0A6B0RRQ5_9CETA|nr:hypothetical protein [Bos mutus]
MEKPGKGLKSDPSTGSSKWGTPWLHGSQDHAMTWVTHLSTPTLKGFSSAKKPGKDDSQSKSWLNRIDKQLIRWRHQAAEAGKVIKGLQLLRAKRFQVNVAGDFAFCHSEDAGHTVVAAEHLVPDDFSLVLHWYQIWFSKQVK